MQKILIVDDEIIMQKMASKILSKKYEIITASSGAEAIELFETQKPDMVLSDLLMPEMDGYELHNILQEKSSRSVPIMFMTADESDESESYGFEIGAADYIRKPLKADILLRRVSNILDNLDKLQDLQQAADIDQMTGLLNKSAATRELERICATEKGALMMIDLDSFKLVNDIHGHTSGDKILIKFAELLKSITRENDLIGRMGGDEFIAFLLNVNDAKILVQKVNFLNEEILNCAKKLMGADMQISLGVSCGAVFVPDEGADFSTLYKKADEALYAVKQNGKHGIKIFSSQNSAKINSDVKKISQLRLILDERNIEPGAYFVDFDTFKSIYRLMFRMVENYKKGVTLMQFSLSTETAAEEFKDTLIHSLRQSDCVTQNGKNFLVLIFEATEDEALIVKDRIFSKLDKNFAAEIHFEREKL